MAQAKTKALSLVARNKNDADAQYFLGAYYGVMAGYEARRWRPSSGLAGTNSAASRA
jgi:hypothetical protein